MENKKKRIFEILKELRENTIAESHKLGLLIVFSDITGVLARGAYPIGKRDKTFDVAGNVNSEDAGKIIKNIGDDGAVLIDEEGNIYSPAVYLNVNLFSVDEKEIKPDFCARHIAALATSSTTKSHVFTLSEETKKVREFFEGKLTKEHPQADSEKILEIIEKDLQREKLKDKIVTIS